MQLLYRLARIFDFLALTLAIIIAAGGDAPRLTGESDRVRFFTRDIEFDYPNWVWGATWLKIEQSTLNAPYLFERGTNKELIFEYLRVTQQLIQTEGSIEQIFADPAVTDKEATSAFLRTQRDELIARQNSLAPFAESVLQSQLSEALARLDLTTAGQPLPPTLYHVSSTPLALIVAPRDHIHQIANVSVLPTLTLDEQIKLEDEVAQSLNVSTLVVGIGGVGVYPTMVTETTDLRWMLETIAHEWTHNYLNIRPLGLNYSTTPELRTMNETTASIAGSEVGNYVLQEYYPEMLASSASLTSSRRFFGSAKASLASLTNRFFFQTNSTTRRPSTSAPKCTRRVSQQTKCWHKARSKKQKPTWKLADNSSGKMDTCFANSIRPTSPFMEPMQIPPAAQPAKTLSARLCAPCANKATLSKTSSTQ